jgi:hypothetical protein
MSPISDGFRAQISWLGAAGLWQLKASSLSPIADTVLTYGYGYDIGKVWQRADTVESWPTKGKE